MPARGKLKHALGKLPLPSLPDDFVPAMVAQHGMSRLPISLEAIFECGKLPMIHRDPFDRLLIAQAIREGCSLVSCDPEIRKYQVALQRVVPQRGSQRRALRQPRDVHAHERDGAAVESAVVAIFSAPGGTTPPSAYD